MKEKSQKNIERSKKMMENRIRVKGSKSTF